MKYYLPTGSLFESMSKPGNRNSCTSCCIGPTYAYLLVPEESRFCHRGFNLNSQNREKIMCLQKHFKRIMVFQIHFGLSAKMCSSFSSSSDFNSSDKLQWAFNYLMNHITDTRSWSIWRTLLEVQKRWFVTMRLIVHRMILTMTIGTYFHPTLLIHTASIPRRKKKLYRVN